MKKTLHILFLTLLITSLGSCTTSSDETIVEETAKSFAERYFTWHFIEANDFATDNMKKRISFIASNVHKSDLDLLHSTSTAPVIEVSDVSFENDSTATATLAMEDVILMDTLGASAHLYKKVESTLKLKKETNNWRVDSEECRIAKATAETSTNQTTTEE